MRLSNEQRTALDAALDDAQLPRDTQVYLFGSRVDPNARGGDIDLLVYCHSCDRETLRRRIRRAYEAKIEERIDVLVIDVDRPDAEAAVFARTLNTERLR